ncbi:MAG: hypothetical protein JXA37_06245 [Chloroflexia bacterium]|nr:hypothetical protein [Chloroflexia bacterium]
MKNPALYRQSIKSGLTIGFMLFVALAFVVINDQVGRFLPGWRMFNFPWIPIEVLRITSLAASSILLLFVGTLAAMRVQAVQLKHGLKAGAISGLLAGMVLYACLLAPLALVLAAGPTWHELLTSGGGLPNAVIEARLSRMVAQTWQLSFYGALAVPLAGLLLGGIEGALYSFLRRASGVQPPKPEPTPALLDLVRQKESFSLPDQEEHTLKAGLLGGLIVGGFFALEVTLATTQLIIREIPEIGIYLNRRLQVSGEASELVSGLVVLMLFFVPLALLFWGGLGVLVLKHPPTRFGSRLKASVIAGTTGGAIFSILVGLPIVNMVLAIAPFPISEAQEAVLTLEGLREHLRMLIVYPIMPLFQILFWLVVGFFTGLPFVFVSPFIWPRRPVDRAASLVRRIRRQPQNLLPEIYGLFQRDRQATEVLLHLARQLHRTDMAPSALVAAAYLALYRQPERLTEAVDVLADTIAAAPEWRWQNEIGELYRFLEEGLRVRNIHHLAAIRRLPEEQTSSLPAGLALLAEKLSQVVDKVKKAHRLDDLNSRTIYLNNALETITAAEQFAGEERAGACQVEGKPCASPLPESEVLRQLLPKWRDLLYQTLRDLRGRAVLRVELKNRQASYLPHLPLYLSVANEGMNVAEMVRIGLDPSADYRLSEQSEARIELLSPGEQQEVQLQLEPRNPRSIRVQLHVYYNDAVEENREVRLADEVVFVQEERPFQRIFPIPYVTGTPLKTDKMFFGRQDVFDYVQEHLLGTYQNNIIVLHGQRRTGKTSVLYRLQEVMKDTHYAVLLDVQGIAARSEAEFFYALSDEIAYALERGGIEIDPPELADFESQPELSFRSRFLRPIYPTLGGRHLLLMFDEFEELQRHVEQGYLGAEVFTFLRNLMQHEVPLDFIFSGTHKLEDLAAEYWSILFNIATYKKISFLERKDADRLIMDPVAPYGMEYDPLAVDHIYAVTAGQPFLCQLVCHEMVAYHNEMERSYLTVADVDAVLERIAERGEAHFKYIWDGSDGAARAVLLALAELLEHGQAATLEEVLELSERRNRSLEREQALSALMRLESRDIMQRKTAGSEWFRFRVDLVRRWISRNPQLADTVELA